MSLIKKFVMVCNRCGAESPITSETESNVNILGEDFFLCDDCLYYILDIINGAQIDSTKQEAKKPVFLRKRLHINSDPDQDEKDKIEFEELTDWKSDDESAKDAANDFDPLASEKREYIKWDDYEVEKIVDLRRQGLTWKEIAKKRKLTMDQIQQFIRRVRYSKPSSKYYTWKTKYNDAFEISELSKNLQHKEKWTDELVEKMFELRKEGMAFNEIAKVLNLKQENIYNLTYCLRNAKPGTRFYELAKKYGYID